MHFVHLFICSFIHLFILYPVCKVPWDRGLKKLCAPIIHYYCPVDGFWSIYVRNKAWCPWVMANSIWSSIIGGLLNWSVPFTTYFHEIFNMKLLKCVKVVAFSHCTFLVLVCSPITITVQSDQFLHSSSLCYQPYPILYKPFLPHTWA